MTSTKCEHFIPVNATTEQLCMQATGRIWQLPHSHHQKRFDRCCDLFSPCQVVPLTPDPRCMPQLQFKKNSARTTRYTKNNEVNIQHREGSVLTVELSVTMAATMTTVPASAVAAPAHRLASSAAFASPDVQRLAIVRRSATASKIVAARASSRDEVIT